MTHQHINRAIVLLLLFFCSYLGFSLLGFDTGANIAAALIAISSVWWLYRAGRVASSFRLSWFLGALALSLWAVFDTLWALWAFLDFGNPAVHPVLQYGYLGTNLCFLGVTLYVSLANRSRRQSLQFFVDVIVLFIALSAFYYVVFFWHTFLTLSHSSVSSMLYLLTDISMLSLIAAILFSYRIRSIPRYLLISLCGLALFTVTDINYVWASIRGSYTPNSWIDILYALSFITHAINALLFLKAPQSRFPSGSHISRSRGIIYRSLVLLLIPILAILTGKIGLAETFFFLILAFGYQTISLVLDRVRQKEEALAENTMRSRILEATIADRTRELRIMNQTLENLLKRDATTGQYNRKHFTELLEEWMANNTIENKIWLLILDFDRFKSVNDTYGHDVGDQVLRQIGKRMEGITNEQTFFARLGGDEFGVVCRRHRSESIRSLIQTINDMMLEPLVVHAFTVHLSVSMGVASWPDDAKTRSDLMRHADIALYIAKNRRVNGVSFFDSLANAGIERSHQIDLALRNVKFDREFTLVYQPQIAIGGRRLIGMEALLRWNSSALGPVSPDEFIPVAEENGTILPLSEWILLRTMEQINKWNRQYGKSLRIGINISPHQLDDIDFLEKLEAIIAKVGIDPAWLNLEITERSAMKDESFIINIFNRLSSLSIVSSIDDFGTGYSSLSYLKKFNINYLKIAKQLIDGIAINETEAQIVQAIIMMATALNLRTIAEGVEDEEQLRILESLGCDEIQGFYFGRPVSPEEFEELYLKG
ncbi:MAG: EAL domain-containing protein [Spirochaetales bacterium]|nr:EAL domain-containing protein [Spirochaetales bacterium]